MITSDTKDWTWVLQRTCPECGFDARSIEATDVPDLLRANAARWRRLPARGASMRQRHRSDRWSPLEYACHVRDVCRLFDERLQLILAEDDPDFPNWDQDATAVDDRYGEQDPEQVAAELERAAEVLAARFDQVTGEQWQRTGRRSDGARFTVDTFARYFIHDLIHHWYDVTDEQTGPVGCDQLT